MTGDLEGARRAVSRMPESSDSMIACFFQVSPELVRDMRLKLPKRIPKSHNWSSAKDVAYGGAEAVFKEQARHGSDRLNALCWGLYGRWGEAHNVPPEVAMAHLQLGARL